jgi:hypothetical protein
MYGFSEKQSFPVTEVLPLSHKKDPMENFT